MNSLNLITSAVLCIAHVFRSATPLPHNLIIIHKLLTCLSEENELHYNPTGCQFEYFIFIFSIICLILAVISHITAERFVYIDRTLLPVSVY